MRRAITYLVLIILSNSLMAQNEAGIWYFGDNAGVDFKSGSPVALTDGAMATREGCATICDRNGDILFYTDGTNVWNKNHQIMENGTGLLGDFSSTQSAIILPKPNSENLFFVITVTSVYNSGDGIMSYSIVDINFNSGLGKVITKNVFIHTPIAEKLTALKKANGLDFWVITHERHSNKFLAFSLTSDGLDIVNPQESNVGSVHSEPAGNFLGYLKASPFGNYLALANSGGYGTEEGLFELFDFDNETAVVSNPILFSGYHFAYGVEFSPDESRLYLGRILDQGEIFQVNLELGNPEDILNSLTSIGIYPIKKVGALQLGPDKNIYVSYDFSNYLGVINEPNLLGEDCDFVLDAVYLEGRQSRYGLPNFVSNFFQADFQYQPDCYGDSTWFSLQYSGAIDSVRWDFGDPATGLENQSNIENPFHVFSAAGSFLVQVIVFSEGSEYPIEKSVFISPAPFVDLGNDTTLCSQSGVWLEAGYGFDTYLWQDGSTDSVFLAEQSGDYWVQVENSCGIATDTIHIDFSSSFEIDIGNDTSFCYGQFVLLSPGSGYYSYYWQDGSTDSVHIAEITGYYWVQVIDSLGCSAIDSLYIDAYMDFGFSLGVDTSVICDGDYIFLHGPGGYESYLWQDGSAYPDFLADTTGIYWLEIGDENGCAARDSMRLIVNKIPDDFLGNDTLICDGEYYTIHAPPHYNKYIWQDGSTDSVFFAWQAGDYWVFVEDSIGCNGVDTISLSLFQPPQLNHSSDTLICPGDSLLLSPGNGWLYYLWNTGSTDSAIVVSQNGSYWVETGTQCGSFFDSVYVDIYTNPDFSLGPDTNICEAETIKLTPGLGFLAYLWNNGTTDSTLLVYEEGNYTVLANDGRCNLKDAVSVESCSLVWIPNVFTPNEDGYNDEFYAIGENVLEFQMVIFNRWGEVLKTLHHIDEKWDGTYNGRLCADGVYYYIANFREVGRDSNLVAKEIRGAVTLISGR